MKLYAQHIMNQNVITVNAEMSCKELISVLLSHKITGVPVVNTQGVLVGMMSANDILRSLQSLTETTDGAVSRHLSNASVADAMEPTVIVAYPHTTVEELANLMYRNQVHRIVIVEPTEKRPIGIVTTSDLLKLIATAETLEALCDDCSTWYQRKFHRIPYEALLTMG